MKNSYNRRVTIDGVTYDSKFEYDLMTETRLRDADYHSGKIPYEIRSSHTYSPDFKIDSEKCNYTYYFEAKGRFNFRHDLNKYIHMKEQLVEDYIQGELIFIFQNPKTPIPGARPRKDGTKLSNGEWATKEGFRWCTKETVDEFIDSLK